MIDVYQVEVSADARVNFSAGMLLPHELDFVKGEEKKKSELLMRKKPIKVFAYYIFLLIYFTEWICTNMC